jgi:hypothetical protein
MWYLHWMNYTKHKKMRRKVLDSLLLYQVIRLVTNTPILEHQHITSCFSHLLKFNKPKYSKYLQYKKNVFSRMWRRAAWQRYIDVSKDSSASVFMSEWPEYDVSAFHKEVLMVLVISVLYLYILNKPTFYTQLS